MSLSADGFRGFGSAPQWPSGDSQINSSNLKITPDAEQVISLLNDASSEVVVHGINSIFPCQLFILPLPLHLLELYTSKLWKHTQHNCAIIYNFLFKRL